MRSDFNMSCEEMSHFVSFPLFGLTLFLKLRHFDFGSNWNTLLFFGKENAVIFEYVLSNNIWFSCLILIMTICWEILTLNFTEIA